MRQKPYFECRYHSQPAGNPECVFCAGWLFYLEMQKAYGKAMRNQKKKWQLYLDDELIDSGPTGDVK